MSQGAFGAEQAQMQQMGWREVAQQLVMEQQKMDISSDFSDMDTSSGEEEPELQKQLEEQIELIQQQLRERQNLLEQLEQQIQREEQIGLEQQQRQNLLEQLEQQIQQKRQQLQQLLQQ